MPELNNEAELTPAEKSLPSSIEEPANADTSNTINEKEEIPTANDADIDLTQNKEKDLDPKKEDTQEWFKKDKYKTIEDQAKAYNELEKGFHEKAKKLAEFEKKQGEIELNASKNIVESSFKEINDEHSRKINSLIMVKSNLISDYTNQLINAGYSGQSLQVQLSQYTHGLDIEYNDLLNQFNQEKQQKTNSAMQHQQTYEQKRKDVDFSRAEKEIADDLKDPAVKHIYDKYKEKYPESKDFLGLLPAIKDAIKIHDEINDKILGINKAKEESKNKQKSINGISISNSSGTGSKSRDSIINKYIYSP